MLFLIAASLADPPSPSVPARMAALYDEVGLRAFPIDSQVDALMATKGARAFAPEEVKVTLRDVHQIRTAG